MKKTILLISLMALGVMAFGQKPKLLATNVNFRNYNVVYPAVSGDGRVMIFMTDYSDDGSFIMSMSQYRAGKWQNPVDINIIGSSKVNNWGGYSLNFDGSEIYFSSRRSNGVGQYDIWYSKFSSGEWSRPINIGKPVNTLGNEGNPSIGPDGQHLYFMRCDDMSNSDVSGCKLYYSEHGPRGWGEAVALPDYINTGNTTSPRILPDNRTLVFASDRPGGKGGIDLWMTKRTGDHWSEPVNIEPVNTEGNDYFLSATMRSIAYYTTMSEYDKKAIAELRLPEEYRIDNVIIAQGTVKDEDGNNLAAEVKVYNTATDTYEARFRLSTQVNDFTMVLPEGASYDVAYNELRLSKMYHTEIIDATDLVAPRREIANVVLKDFKEGLTSRLQGVKFEPFTAVVSDNSALEISRLARVMNQHPELSVEIGTYQSAYLEEQEKISEDLSETRIDTTFAFEPSIRIDTLDNAQLDEMIRQINTELSETLADTTITTIYLARMASIDSVEVQKLVPVYHNDRTLKQSEAVKESLMSKGVAESRIKAVGYRDQEPPVPMKESEERLVVVKFLSGLK